MPATSRKPAAQPANFVQCSGAVDALPLTGAERRFTVVHQHDDATRNTVARAHGRALSRRFTGAPLTGFGDL